MKDSTAGEMTPSVLRDLKREIFSSLRCAVPGTVESYDPGTQTVSVRPAARRKGIPLPLLRDVPVFFPGSRDSALTFPVSPGDGCLLVFADADTDRWFEGEDGEPASGRMHDLSDAFAFVGFRSRPAALTGLPGRPSFFGVDPAEAGHRHTAGEIISGTLALERGGTGQATVGSSESTQGIAVPESGVTISSAQYAWWGKVAMVRLTVTRKTAVSSGTTTLCTLAAGKRPKFDAPAQWIWGGAARILSNGKVQVNGAVPAGTSLTILSTFLLA